MLGVITVTPLQLLIADKVLEHRGTETFYLLNINAHDGTVLNRSFSKLAAQALDASYQILDGSGLENLQKVRAVLRMWKKEGVNELLFASIDNIVVQYSLAYINPQKFETFDDGSVNVIRSGLYHQKSKLGPRRTLVYNLIRKFRDQDWVKKHTALHYTIFDFGTNIVEASRLKRISIFDPPIEEAQVLSGGEVSVFLGFSQSEEYRKAVTLADPDYYLPHPMEKDLPVTREVVYTDLIAEEFLANLLSEYSRIKVFACGSTVLWNLNSTRIDRYVVDLPGGDENWRKEYNSFALELGCKLLTLEDLAVTSRA